MKDFTDSHCNTCSKAHEDCICKVWKSGQAFRHYLLNVGSDEAIVHLYHCFMQGSSDSMVWDLIQDIYGPGNFPAKPGELLSFFDDLLVRLRKMMIVAISR